MRIMTKEEILKEFEREFFVKRGDIPVKAYQDLNDFLSSVIDSFLIESKCNKNQKLHELCRWFEDEINEQQKKCFWALRKTTNRLMKDWSKVIELLNK